MKSFTLNADLSEFCCFHNSLMSSSLRAAGASVAGAAPPSKPRRCFLPLSLSESDLRERLRRRAAEDETADDLYASGDTGFGSLGGVAVHDVAENWSLQRNVKSTRSIRSAPSSDLLRKTSTSAGYGRLVRASSARDYDGSRLAIAAVRASNRRIRQRKANDGLDGKLNLSIEQTQLAASLSCAEQDDAGRPSDGVTPLGGVCLRTTSDSATRSTAVHSDWLQNRRQKFLMTRENALFNSCDAAMETYKDTDQASLILKRYSYVDTIKRYNRALGQSTERPSTRDCLDQVIHDLEVALAVAPPAASEPPSPQLRAARNTAEESAPQRSAFSKFLLSAPKSQKSAANGESTRPKMTVKEVKKGGFRFLRRPNLTVEVTPIDRQLPQFRVLDAESPGSAKSSPASRRNSLICLTRQPTIAAGIDSSPANQRNGSLATLPTIPPLLLQEERQRGKRASRQRKLKQRRSCSNDSSFASISFLHKSPVSLLRNVIFSAANNNSSDAKTTSTVLNPNGKRAESAKSVKSKNGTMD